MSLELNLDPEKLENIMSKPDFKHNRVIKQKSLGAISTRSKGENIKPYRQLSDGSLLLRKRKDSNISRRSFLEPFPMNPDIFNTLGSNEGRKLPMCYFYHHTDQDHADEDVNNNDQDDDHLELDEAFSEPLNRAGKVADVMNGVSNILQFWRTFIIILTPILLSPLLSEIGTSEAKCGFVILLMAIYWVTEAIPLPITALLPVILFPVLGVMTTDDVCVKYLKESNMMFVGGLIVAIAVEHCRLHQRIALRVLLLIGTSPRLLMLGFMLPTMFLSMWISNTATTAMMVPIVEAVLAEINGDHLESGGLETISEEKDLVYRKQELDSDEKKAKKRKIRIMIYLSVAYAANVGGTGTLTGTGPNLVLKGMLSTLFGDTPINFASWMGFACPIMLLNLVITWAWLQLYFMGVPWGKNRIDIGDKATLRRVLQDKYNDLGSMSFHQAAVLFNFIVLVLLWFFRDPQFITGWGEYFMSEEEDTCGRPKLVQSVDDASAALLIVFILFITPSKLTFWPFTTFATSHSSPALIDWRTIHDRFPWGVMLLFGGGFALADGSKASGLSDWIGMQLSVLDSLPQGAVVLIICVMTAIVTEVTSNVATANILLPVLAELANATNINPLYFMIPATITCSFAFMLPVATPPNAIVFSASGMRTSEMMAVGSIMNVICIVVTMVAVNSYGLVMFNLDTFPDWAQSLRKESCPIENMTEHFHSELTVDFASVLTNNLTSISSF